MFEFSKLCKEFQNLSPVERGAILAAKSVKVVAKLDSYDIEELDPVQTLVAFIIGAVAADGVIDEKEYLLIYPSLVKAFGTDFNYDEVKDMFKKDREAKKAIHNFTADLLSVLAEGDDELREDVITLCLCVLSIDGRITIREKNYIKKLIKA